MRPMLRRACAELRTGRRACQWLAAGLLAGMALVTPPASAQTAAQPGAWPDNTRLSGNAFLPPGLLDLQNETGTSPVTLWLDKGKALWTDRSGGQSCEGCHGAAESLKNAAAKFPRLAADGQRLINLEDQVLACSARTGRTSARAEDDDVLSLSAGLHNAAKGQLIDVQAPSANAAQWQTHLGQGAQLFSRRIGRMNLACVHCHEQNVGRQMRAEVISPGHPTGFPIYRMSWQRMGSIERRLRACYSGVQAVLPPQGAVELRQLELYLKVRANGMPVDGPSIRR